MSRPEFSSQALLRTAAGYSARSLQIALFALVLAVAALSVPGPEANAMLMAGAGALTALLALLWGLGQLRTRRARLPAATAAAFAASDAAPGFATDGEGRVIYRNAAATARFGVAREATLIRALGELFANPAAVIYRLQARAEAQGGAREDVVTRRGHVRISVHRFAGSAFFWRFDEMEERGGGRGAEMLSLPMITAGRNDAILFMNEAARRLLGGRVKSLENILPQRAVRSGAVSELNGAAGPVAARIVEMAGRGGRREIYFLPADPAPARGGGDMQFFDTLPVALLKLRPDGTVTLANRQARALLGRGGEGLSLPEMVEGLGRSVLDWLDEAAQGRVANRAEVLRVQRDDKEVFLRITLKRIVEDGEAALMAVLTDATEMKTLEAQFVQSQKMQAIGQLAGGVAHDFNNLLTAISGHCDLLLLRHDQGDPDFGDLMQINQNANRAASLVGQLLAFSRKQTLRPEIVDLRDSLTDLTHLLNRLVGERVSLTVSHDPGLSPIRADKRQLEQVIMNLVVNARDAMPEGGEIRIETAMHRLDATLERDRASVPPGRYVLVRVIDEGEGIAPDKLDKIFEPFYTTKRVGEGTGLGLSTAYGIVKQTGGFIFADSAPGTGTCFTLYFPAHDAACEAAGNGPVRRVENAAAQPAPAEPEADHALSILRVLEQSAAAPAPAAADTAAVAPVSASDGPARGEGVVLLVEDEAPVRAFASRALRMRGFTVLEAGNAEEALETLSDERIAIDVFVTDVVMPGMDGPSWVKRALKDRPDTRVVFVSGYAEEAFADTQARIPNSVFLPKPFSLSELTSTVREQMH